MVTRLSLATKRFGWMLFIWCMSVLALAVVASAFRLLMLWAGLMA